jgi:hypothetical protein
LRGFFLSLSLLTVQKFGDALAELAVVHEGSLSYSADRAKFWGTLVFLNASPQNHGPFHRTDAP